MAASEVTQSELGVNSNGSAAAAVAVSSAETPSAAISVSSSTSLALSAVASSPVPVTPVVAVTNLPPVIVSGSSHIPVAQSAEAIATAIQPSIVTPLNVGGSGCTNVPPGLVNAKTSVTYAILLL